MSQTFGPNRIKAAEAPFRRHLRWLWSTSEQLALQAFCTLLSTMRMERMVAEDVSTAFCWSNHFISVIIRSAISTAIPEKISLKECSFFERSSAICLNGGMYNVHCTWYQDGMMHQQFYRAPLADDLRLCSVNLASFERYCHRFRPAKESDSLEGRAPFNEPTILKSNLNRITRWIWIIQSERFKS